MYYVYFPSEDETNIACWLFWCLVLLSVFLKIYFLVNLSLNLMVVWYQVPCQLLAVLVKNHFVPIFAICMALHCIKESGWEKAAIVPQSSILRLAEVSGSERDKLIKEHMVCICFSSLSLSLKDSGTLRSMTCVKVLV